MAMIECPECGKRISTMAPECPSCGILQADIQKMLTASKTVGKQQVNVEIFENLMVKRFSKICIANVRCIRCDNVFSAVEHIVCPICGQPTLSLAKVIDGIRGYNEKREAAKSETKTFLIKEGVKLGQKAATKEEAIHAAGELLCSLGYVDASYISAMQARERIATTYLGMGIAIPHGLYKASDAAIKKSGIVVLQYPEGVPFGDEKANLVIGFSGIGDEHMEVLSNIGNALEDEDVINDLLTAKNPDIILKHLQ